MVRSININDTSIQYPLQHVVVPLSVHPNALTCRVHPFALHEVRVEVALEILPVGQE